MIGWRFGDFCVAGAAPLMHLVWRWLVIELLIGSKTSPAPEITLTLRLRTLALSAKTFRFSQKLPALPYKLCELQF